MSNSALQRYEVLLVGLHREMRAGRGDGEHAEGLRHELASLWYELSDEEQGRFDEVSEDLYIIEGKRRIAPGPVATLEEIHQAFKANDNQRALSLIRTLPEPLKPQYIFVLGRCWAREGFHRAAVCFLDHANALEPNDVLEMLALQELVAGGDIIEAVARANDIANRPDASAALAIEVAAVFFHHVTLDADNGSPSSREILQRVVGLVEDFWNDPVTPSFIRVRGLLVAGLAHERLGQSDLALQSFERAVELDPSPATLLARGLTRMRLDRPGAEEDIICAASMKPPVDWPYVFAARRALEDNKFSEVEQFCVDGLSFARDSEVRGRLYEWRAIAAASLRRSPAEVLALFNRALAEIPLDPVLRRNLNLYRKSLVVEQSSSEDRFEFTQQRLDVARAFDGLVELQRAA